VGELEDEIKQLLWREVAADPQLLEVLVSGAAIEASTDDLFRVVLAKQQALEKAVLRVARELDRIAGTDTDE